MFIDVNGINLYYEKRGEGRPLIMLHGNGESCKIFYAAVKLLEKQFAVYLVDSRGHGKSGKVTEFHYDDMCEDMHAFIEKLELEKPIVYGFSDGGIIALLLSIKYPTLTSEIIVSGANLNPDGLRKGYKKMFDLIYKLSGDPKDKMLCFEPNITAEDLSKITIPVTVIAGSRDLIDRSHTEYIAANIKNSSLKIMQGYGHGGYIVHNKIIAKVIINALKSK